MLTTTNQSRVECDGCGYAVLEAPPEDIQRVFRECGWINRLWNGKNQDVCPACQPERPPALPEGVHKVLVDIDEDHRKYLTVVIDARFVSVAVKSSDVTEQ